MNKEKTPELLENNTNHEENVENKKKRRKKTTEPETTKTTEVEEFAIGSKCLALWRDEKYRKNFFLKLKKKKIPKMKSPSLKKKKKTTKNSFMFIIMNVS